MTFRASATVDMAPAYQVGVAVKVVSRRRGLLHVGLLYKNRDGEIRLAHLKRNDVAANETAANDQGFFWDDCAWLAKPKLEALADSVALFIELCAETREIPYGPNPPVDAFDADGKYVCTDRQLGLTCATYVSSILAGAGYPVVKFETWRKRDDDQAWWDESVRHLERARADELDGVKVKARLRPDEIAVSAAAEDRPLRFSQAVERSVPLRDILREDTEPSGMAEAEGPDAPDPGSAS